VAEARLGVDAPRLARAVARSYRRLLATKDEYEVARLYTDGDFGRSLAAAFEGDYRVGYHFARPFSGAHRACGDWPAKHEYGRVTSIVRCPKRAGSIELHSRAHVDELLAPDATTGNGCRGRERSADDPRFGLCDGERARPTRVRSAADRFLPRLAARVAP
jgi:hypothetical protein